MDGMVRTVLGDVPADWIGRTLCHEHVVLDVREHTGDPEHALLGVEQQAGELRQARRLGLSTLVDCTSPEWGRDPLALSTISQASGVQIVAGTGHYPHEWVPDTVADLSAEQLAEVMVRDIQEGIGDSGVRAGLIGEIGTSQGAMSPFERTVFEAAALAQRATGVPLSTHTSAGALGSRQLDLLVSLGVDPRRVLIGHMDDGPSALGACVAIARRGAYVGVDRVGDTARGSDDTRLRLVLDLAERGLLERVLVSHDLSHPSRLLANGGHGYAAVLDDFAPRLREQGLSDQEIELLLVHNPRRFLAT